MDKLRIGVIGVGGRGNLAAHAHKPEDGVRIVAGADVYEPAIRRFQEKYGQDSDLFVTDDYRKLLERKDIQAVFVTSPDYLHEEQAIAALQAGKAVYLEKPIAISIEGCDRILQSAFETRSKLYVGHNMRHMAFVLKMKELIDGGAIGEVKTAWCRHFIAYGGDAYFKDWHSERAKCNSLMLQKACHDIDVLHWLCGSYTRRVNAMGGLTVYDKVNDRRAPEERGNPAFNNENWPPLSQTKLSPVIDVEDLNMAQMELHNGVFVAYQQCHYSPDAWRNYTVIGTEGRIENFNDFGGECVIKLWNKRVHYGAEGNEQFAASGGIGGHGGGDPNIVAEFVRYVRAGGAIKTSPVAARYSVATGCMAAASVRENGTLQEVPSLPREIEEYFAAVTS